MSTITPKLSFIDKLGCTIIGWKKEIFSQCGESSRRAMKKYLAAITILSFIWGTVGYCFAGNYIGLESLWQKALVALVFILVIVCIERFIILNDGSRLVGAMRIVLAILMAVLGSTIFDQIIFKHDVQSEMKDIRETQIQEAIPIRLGIINADITSYQTQIDSISQANIPLYEQLAARPVIKTYVTKTNKVKTGRYDEDGKEIVETHTETQQVQVSNPISQQVAANENVIKEFSARIAELQEKKLAVEKDIREEYALLPTGFLEELAALFQLLRKKPIAMVFYIFLFLFLMSLEMLVVTSKFGEKKCDYDLIVEHELAIKQHTLQQTALTLTNK